MASLAEHPRLHSSQQQGQISPKVSSDTEHAGAQHLRSAFTYQLDATSNPSSESHRQQTLPNDTDAFLAPADSMSSAYVDNGFGITFDDLMTPDYSSENQISEHTTPQEAIWEEQFNRHFDSNNHNPYILDSSFGDVPTSPPTNPSREIQSILSGSTQYVTSQQLLSPQLTTPSPSNSARQRTSQETTGEDLSMDRAGKKRGADSLHVSTDSSSFNAQHIHHNSLSAHSPRPRSKSPVILVSSHSHGDSPAEAIPPRRLSQANNSYFHDYHNEADVESYGQTSSNLMAPADEEIEDSNRDPLRTGQDPRHRGNEEVPTVNQLANNRQLDERNQEVEEWIERSVQLQPLRVDRPRAHSTGANVNRPDPLVYNDQHIPGPGVLIHEESDDEYSEFSALASESDNDSPIAESPAVDNQNLEDANQDDSYFPSYEDDEIPPEMQDPLPRQFYRRGPWQDAFQGPIRNDPAERIQPPSSMAAIMRYDHEVAKWESASRAATWGTRRRLSESEVLSIVDGSRVRHMSLVQRSRARGSTLIKRAKSKANEIMPRRSNSNIKKSAAETPQSPELVQMVESPQPRDLSNPNALQRLATLTKTRSPPLEPPLSINVDNAKYGEAERVKSEGLRSPLQMLRKARSKSDVGRASNKSSPGLQELFTQVGGPPVMSLASSAEPVHQPKREPILGTALDEEDDDMEESGVTMDLNVRADSIIPNLEGFKSHARQLNPRLPLYLVDRVAHEQIRRYKKLVENRVKHARAVQNQSCSSAKFCYALGGDAILLAPKPSAKDPEAIPAQFSVQEPEDVEIAEAELEEGAVTPAQFPHGIPLPPVKRLPAEFECSLCFKVKKFQKPSDWTKHVHEDVQPFSCTFPNCSDPKSFKRKADWVRHENERHRRLEFWKCSVQDCNHVCYRKDNFVQHLVREHKKTEPKIKTRGSRGKVETSWSPDQDEVWQLVVTCRHEAPNRPQDEPCRFCGNICTSWKKLSVHMSKHMEQIAMPMLELARMREVTPDTIISPIEQAQQQQAFLNMSRSRASGPGTRGIPLQMPDTFTAIPSHMNGSPALSSQHDPSLSPYARSAHSHPNSSAGHSPALGQMPAQLASFGYDRQYYDDSSGLMHNRNAYGQDGVFVASGYNTHTLSSNSQYGNHSPQVGTTYAVTNAIHTPLSAQSMPMPMSAVSTGYGPHESHYPPTSQAQSFQNYPTNSNSDASFHDGMISTDTEQHQYGMSNQYGAQQPMYPQQF
jgi:hypothetical protein